MTPGESNADDQEVTIDLSVQTAGLRELLVKVYFSTEDDPSCMGLRAMALVANAGASYIDFTPALVDRVITDAEMGAVQPSEPDATEPAPPAGGDEPADSQWIIWVVVAAVVLVGAVVVVKIVGGKKKEKK